MSDQDRNNLDASDAMSPAPAGPRAAPGRPSVHNSHVDQDTAAQHLCGNVHLASGRQCLLPEYHYGGCVFVVPLA